MKKSMTLFLAFLFAAILAGCAANPFSPDTAESDHVQQEQHSENDEPNTPNDGPNSVQYESNGYALSLPGDYIESVIVNPEDNLEESPEYTLFSVSLTCESSTTVASTI